MANQDQNYLGPRTHPPNLQKSTSFSGAKLHYQYQYTGKEQKTSSSKDESRVHHSESRSPRLSKHLAEDDGSGSTLDQRLSRQLTVDYGGGSTVDQRSQLGTSGTKYLTTVQSSNLDSAASPLSFSGHTAPSKIAVVRETLPVSSQASIFPTSYRSSQYPFLNPSTKVTTTPPIQQSHLGTSRLTTVQSSNLDRSPSPSRSRYMNSRDRRKTTTIIPSSIPQSSEYKSAFQREAPAVYFNQHTESQSTYKPLPMSSQTQNRNLTIGYTPNQFQEIERAQREFKNQKKQEEEIRAKLDRRRIEESQRLEAERFALEATMVDEDEDVAKFIRNPEERFKDSRDSKKLEWRSRRAPNQPEQVCGESCENAKLGKFGKFAKLSKYGKFARLGKFGKFATLGKFSKYYIRTMPNSCKEFSISENVKNISRFVDGERYHTNLEDRFNIPWRIRIEKTNDNFQLYLRCEKEECENRKWSIETEITLKLVSHNGKSLMKNWKYTFAKPTGRGFEFISWKELESDYVVDDSIVVEAHVKILNILDSPCTETMNQKTFMLNHTVQNVSNIKERGIYTTNVETHYNIPWRIEIQRREGFFGMYLQCEKKHFDSKDWSIEVELVLTLKSSNGQRLSFTASSTLNEPASYGYDKLIRWDDMERKYAVNDSIIIEARVKIIKMTGFEERPPVGRLSGIVIPVGDREYSMEEWMEMAFGC
ncbi:MATH domain-containing protein [Caenorhabditis elegans]|uniref:MATH domain-containing protein n=1 Tax=Caenorhabditis elegans TaxID=6239 RepID=O76640_CAEEL|nr:MATH domain-containing protein [Caenorhabditis elegans]CCD63723.1 MATH domain-containing protein [Caenorhabditis elegans]|eukprot:NP_494086.2 MATH (meprin-associated Traf homology) domain containing [Caenorhabditis elegans]